ncbi:hypothetical protein ISN44_As11g022260 [Arabidopsis suecica]|uniref:Uncharacterized protein n=1 Tax=Arabidopsis suecica TaxID=45249 RepID=A0A8T1ZCY5_ARASU|nr:hypothetical protein ISN44_As11g022260 [Arabidopsis suecica]
MMNTPRVYALGVMMNTPRVYVLGVNKFITSIGWKAFFSLSSKTLSTQALRSSFTFASPVSGFVRRRERAPVYLVRCYRVLVCRFPPWFESYRDYLLGACGRRSRRVAVSRSGVVDSSAGFPLLGDDKVHRRIFRLLCFVNRCLRFVGRSRSTSIGPAEVKVSCGGVAAAVFSSALASGAKIFRCVGRCRRSVLSWRRVVMQFSTRSDLLEDGRDIY